MSIRNLITRAKVASDLADDILWLLVTAGLSIMYALMVVGSLARGYIGMAVVMLVIGMASIRVMRAVKLAMDKFKWKDYRH